MNTQPYFLLAESDLHPGTGKVEGKAIDNPIQREMTTRFPQVESSGLRGAIKANFRLKSVDKETINALFGKDPDTDQNQTKGLLKLQKSRLVLMPVYSPNHAVTVYLTCPWVLRSLQRDLTAYSHGLELKNVPTALADDECYADKSILHDNHAFAAEYALENIEDEENVPTINGESFRKQLAESMYPVTEQNDAFKDLREITEKRIVLVSDLFFSHCVQYKTTVHIGNHIDPKTGVVKTGALYSVEYLPQGTLLYTVAAADTLLRESEQKVFATKPVLDTFDGLLDQTNRFFTLGGKSSVGKGHVKMEKVNFNPNPVTES